MKYFTQDLLDRYGSEVDEIANVADEEWERRLSEYQTYYSTIKQDLPVDFKELHDKYTLHDAKVRPKVGLASAFAGYFYLEVFPEAMKDGGLLCTYQLKDAPRVMLARNAQAIPLDQAFPLGDDVYWMYDEVSIASRLSPWTFCHSILLSNGLELQLDFTDFKLDKIAPVKDPKSKEKALA